MIQFMELPPTDQAGQQSMDQPALPSKLWQNRTLRFATIFVTLALLFFAAGLVPMWMKARAADAKRKLAERELRMLAIQSTLASAAINARRGDYESARQEASRFFTGLREEFDAGRRSVFTEAQRAQLQPLSVPRDNLITLLARSDPAAADRLSDLYVAYRKAAGK